MKDTLIIDSVTKTYNDKKILTDVYLKCETHDIIGVFGRNGSGKSTLLKIIHGTLQAEHKFVKLNDKVLQTPFKVRNGISYFPQDNFIPNSFSVKKAIDLSINKDKLNLFYDDILLNKILNEKVGTLSGGELKYLQVKLVLFNDSKFCLLDEPYSGVSPILANTINQMILEQSKHKGIIITDHNYQYLLDIATKIYLIKDGFGRFLQNKEALIENGYLNVGSLNE